MIDKAMQTICSDLNAFYKSRYHIDEEKVIIANLISQEGNIAAGDINKLVLTLINIEQESTLKNQRDVKDFGDEFHRLNNPLQINFYFVCAAHFADNNYTEALKFISTVLHFFQHKKTFNHENTPELDSEINRLTLELVNLDLQSLSGFWSFIGAKYLPSLIFKVRMLTYQDDRVRDIQSPASKPVQT